MLATRASPARLSDAIAAADARVTVLDDKVDIEDHAVFLWLRAHELHRNAHHHLVVGDQVLPEPWQARTLRFTSVESAAVYLRPLMRDAVALRALGRFGRGLSDFRGARAHEELVNQVAGALVSGDLWAMEVRTAPVSRFVGRTSPAVFAALNPKFATNIDFAYIARLEGNQWLRGYVPMRDGIVVGRSGMTVASGFDVGQWSQAQLRGFDFPKALLDKILPFANHPFQGMGKARVAALVAKLAPVPELTKPEADLCDGAVFSAILIDAIGIWERGRGRGVPVFRDLPSGWQTVWLSRNYQEGGATKNAQAKAFRAAALAGQWKDAVAKLRGYTDYLDRARAEAALLSAELPPDPKR